MHEDWGATCESIKLGDGRKTYYALLIYLSGGQGQETKAELSDKKDSSVMVLEKGCRGGCSH